MQCAGFTIIEMLVVLAIIVMLIGILVVALSKAAASGQHANTTFLMSSIASGVAQFEGDHGFVPPVLGDNGTPPEQPGWGRDVISPANAGSIQEWYSVTTLAEYLIGYGGRDEDGYGVVGDVANASGFGRLETPPLGIRSPGKDGVWGAWFNPRGDVGAPGGFFRRNPGNAGTEVPSPYPNTANNGFQIDGRVYGPYIELKDTNLLGGLRADGSIAGPEEDDYDLRPKVILDYWGTPIRYYRRPYSGGDPSIIDQSTNLGDVFALRPWIITTDLESIGAADPAGDNSTTPQLKGALYSLMSAGPNRLINQSVRVDTDENNRDNIVEVGN
jgi:prepilin-type N-terminal cleavage/methylation domain-containing protein